MLVSRRGSDRNEGTLRTEGTINARYRTSDRSLHVTASRVPNFNLGTGHHDWDIALSVSEFGALADAMASAAKGPHRRSIAKGLAPHVVAIRQLLSACDAFLQRDTARQANGER